MSEDAEQDARLARAAMKILAAQAPADLKAELKRLARSQAAAPPIWEGLREALSGGAWAYGAGAAFATASVAAFLWTELPGRQPAPTFSPPAPVEVAAKATPQMLREMWSDDEGEDNDEG
ncbi:MAG: hypothetical protein HYZ74_03035 [Elusimicrobia bacterium]|nr:hypothetical protein [Elusimicrobiota bacterium]